jgi:TDG/mug DNA glycosylase family protein
MNTAVRPRRTCPVPPHGPGLQPVSGERPFVLILGSFPGRQSLAAREYYGNPQNHFWKIMENLFSIDSHLPYVQRCSLLTGHGIALWDVIAGCSREGSADREICNPRFNDLAGFLTTHLTVRLIALNGTTAGRYYAESRVPGSVPSVILPSTSPANARSSLPEKIHRWEIVRTICCGDGNKKE